MTAATIVRVKRDRPGSVTAAMTPSNRPRTTWLAEDGATPAPFAFGRSDRMSEANIHMVTAVLASFNVCRVQ
jgi:hypothetical protein